MSDRDQVEIVAGFSLDEQRDAQIVQRCLSLCSLFNLSGDDLVNSWLAYSYNNKIEDDNITLARLDLLERYLHEENQKKLTKQMLTTPKKPTTLLVRQKNTVSPLAVSQTQRLTSSFSSQLDAALSVTAKPPITVASPAPKARQQPSTSFMSPSMLGSPPAPSGPWAQRKNRGRVVQGVNLELNDFRAASREDRENLPLGFELEKLSGHFRYQFQPDDLVNQLKEEREDALLESILSEQFEGATLDALHPLSEPSAAEVIYGGSIWTYNSTYKVHITDTWLRRHDQRVLLTLPTDDAAQWGFFPGMVCVIKGFNPTGNNLLVKQLFAPRILPSPSPMLTDSQSSEISIIFAAGPFCCGDDLAYTPLFDLLEEVRSKAPTLLVLSGPFLNIENETPTPKPYTEIRAELWRLIAEKLEGVETRVLTVPHIREAHHVACFPQPCILKSQPQKMNSKIVHLPNPCFFTVGHTKICVMSHDIIFHLAGNEISKTAAGTQANRISRLCSYLLEQRSLYPLTVPPSNASIDWTHLKKFGLDSIPDLFLLPSQLGQYVRSASNSVFINSGQLVKGSSSSGTFARIVIHPGSAPIQDRTRVEIVRI